MRVKTDKFRTKRINKRRMTETQVIRANAKRVKYTLLDYWFDRDEPDQQSVAHHMNRRYP
jgi:hypothetical protein